MVENNSREIPSYLSIRKTFSPSAVASNRRVYRSTRRDRAVLLEGKGRGGRRRKGRQERLDAFELWSRDVDNDKETRYLPGTMRPLCIQLACEISNKRRISLSF